jgi:ABC-type bacteriocin/lantibiotic exporter with double-glycine peptidase domain/CRP-like cAMP-binding protein
MKILDITFLLKQNPYFGILSEHILQEIQQDFNPITFDLGEDIIHEGNRGEAFYMIYSGKARVISELNDGRTITLGTLHRGDSFGEQSLLHHRPVTKTVRASSRVVLLVLSRERFEVLVQNHPEFRAQLEERIRSNFEVNFLRTLNVFSCLSYSESRELVASIRSVHLRTGEFLFREGDPGDTAYVIRSGLLEVLKESSQNLKLAQLDSGSLIGEMSLLHSQPRSAGIRAIEDSVLLALDRKAFLHITARSQNFQDLISRQAARRLMQTDTLVRSDSLQTGQDRSLIEFPVEHIRYFGGIRSQIYPLVRVNDTPLTGMACITMIRDWFGIENRVFAIIDPEAESWVQETFFTLGRKLESCGFLTRELKIGRERLSSLSLPVILKSSEGRFCVLYEVHRNGVVLGDPLQGISQLSWKELEQTWEGSALSIRHLPDLAGDASSIKSDIKLSMIKYLSLTVLLQLTACMVPMILMVLIDQSLLHAAEGILTGAASALLVVSLIQLFGETLREAYLALHLEYWRSTLLLRSFRHLLSLPLSILRKWQDSERLEMFRNAEFISRTYPVTVWKGMEAFLSLAIPLSLLFLVHIDLAVISTFGIFLYGAIELFGSGFGPKVSRSEYDRSDPWKIRNLFTGILSLKGAGMEEAVRVHALNRFVLRERERTRDNASRNQLENSVLVLKQILGLGVVVLCVRSAQMGELSAGALIAFIILLGFILKPLHILLDLFRQSKNLRQAWNVTSELLETPTDSSERFTRVTKLQGHIVLQNLTSAPQTPGMKAELVGVNLEIFPGQKVAILEPDGNSASTIAYHIVNLLTPASGSVSIDGYELNSLDPWMVRRQVGYVSSKLQLFAGSIRENLSILDPGADFEQVVAASIFSGLHRFVESLPWKYETRLGEGALSLSEVRRQQLLIARAILVHPSILILDEAATAMSTQGIKSLWNNLANLMSDGTLIWISPELPEDIEVDKTYFLHDSKLMEEGAWRALESNPHSISNFSYPILKKEV